MKCVLTIAGSDSGGGAGIQADLKTFEQFGVFGITAITAITAQNTTGVSSVEKVSPSMITDQLVQLLKDFDIKAAKTGMLPDEASMNAVSTFLSDRRFPLVVDPVMISTSGDRLQMEGSLPAFRKKIIPLATILTPNLTEAEILSGLQIRNRSEMEDAAAAIANLNPDMYVLVKGGHLQDTKVAPDLLYFRGTSKWFESERVPGKPIHGAGCTFSAAIAAQLGAGTDIVKAVENSKLYITKAIKNAPSNIGKGNQPLLHRIK